MNKSLLMHERFNMRIACQRLILVAAAVSATVTLSGCSALFGNEGYFRDRGDDYLKSEAIPPIEVPEGVDPSAMEQLYVIPPVSSRDFDLEEGFEVPRPQPLAANLLTEKVKIQRLGKRRWILINTRPSEVWPRVRNFLNQNRLQVAFTDATNGIVETGWLQFKTDTEFKNKYRLQIEQGVQPDSTEIHVVHMSIPADVPAHGQVNWPEQSVDPERESWMLDELAATLASEVTGGATSLLAQTIGGDAKVELTATDAEPVLKMGIDLVRAWATVGHAVQQEGFSLWDEDAVIGIYYVNYSNPKDEEEAGWFSRWFGGDDDDQPATSPYTLQEVLSHLQLEDTEENRAIFSSVATNGGGELLEDAPGYLVVVRGQDGDVEVRIRDAYAKTLSPKQAKRLLVLIRRNLI